MKSEKIVHKYVHLYPSGKKMIDYSLLEKIGVEYPYYWSKDIRGERDGVSHWWNENGTRDEFINFKEDNHHGVRIRFRYKNL